MADELTDEEKAQLWNWQIPEAELCGSCDGKPAPVAGCEECEGTGRTIERKPEPEVDLVGQLRYMARVEGREVAGRAADEIERLKRGLTVAAEDANYWRGAHERLSKLVAEKGLRP